MTILEMFFWNPVAHYAVVLGFIIYNFYHIVMIDRLLQQHQLDLGFSDRLLLFRVPIWQPKIQLNDAVLTSARHLSKQFIFVVFIWIMFYVITFTLIVFG